MAGDVGKSLDLLDAIVAKAQALGADRQLDSYARIARQTRSRMGFLGETVVVALAGGTGVGKSSLLNAIAGEPVAPAGRIRPTTDHPLVWMPAEPEPGLVRLIDELGIDEQIGHDHQLNLAILDLPDFDSISLAHRETFERLIPRVDAVIWVLDPEKYADRSLHDGYLRPLAGYQSQFVFVLNQIDRLTGEELESVRGDLKVRLVEDGVEDPAILETSADPASGRPIGVEPLVSFLDVTLDAKRTAVSKLVEDLRRAGRGIADVSGVEPGEGLDFDQRWDEARGAAISSLGRLLAGRQVLEAAEEAGRRQAARIGSGPVGMIVSRLRTSLLGRALGARDEEQMIEDAARNWQGRSGLEDATDSVTSVINDLSFRAGGGFGAELRKRLGEVESELAGTAEATLAAPRVRPVPRRLGWWRYAAVCQWVITLAVLGAVLWGWAKPETLQRGSWPWPLVVAGTAVLLGLALAHLVRRSGQREGRRTGAGYRADLERIIADRIDRRIGRPLRALIRDRAELGGLLSELAVELARIEAADRGS